MIVRLRPSFSPRSACIVPHGVPVRSGKANFEATDGGLPQSPIRPTVNLLYPTYTYCPFHPADLPLHPSAQVVPAVNRPSSPLP